MDKLILIRAVPAAVYLVLLLLSPPLSAADLGRAKTLMGEGKLQEALTATNEVLEEDEESTDARFIKGLILTKLNRLDEARDVFLDITTDHPDLPEPYNNLAVIYAAQGQYEKARVALQNAINTHPSYATAHENLGDIFAKMASQAYNQALELDKDNETAREKLSLISELFSAPGLETPKEASPAIASTEQAAAPEPEKAAVSTPPATEQKQQEPPVTADTGAETGAAPATASAEPVVPQKAEKNAVLQAVYDWRDAWAGQNVKTYISHYADDFSPPGLSRKDWLEQRRERLSSPRFIKVSLASEEVIMHGNDHAQVNFSQSYQSDTYSDQVRKTLLLKRIRNRWLIVQENTD